MHNYHMLIALDVARQRSAEASAARFVASARPLRHGPGRVRRTVARVAFAIGRAADRDGALMNLGPR